MSYGPRAEWNLATRQATWGSCRVSKRSASTSPGWSARPKITGKTSVHSRVAPAFDSRLKVSLINKAKFSCQNWLFHANKGLKIYMIRRSAFYVVLLVDHLLVFTETEVYMKEGCVPFDRYKVQCFFFNFLLWFTLLTTLTNTFIYTIYNNYKIYNFVSPLHYQQNYLTIQLLTHYLQYNAITGVTYNDTIASLTLQNKVQCA